MDLQAKTLRKRVANFTTDEKALLAQLIKNKPIIESKSTDGKSIAKKQAAWELVTREFNCHANVNKRETNTLKRAWDNMKAWTRKTRAIERGNLIRTGGGPQQPLTSSQHGAIISMVEDAAPVMICEIENVFDSDGTILSAIDSQEVKSSQELLADIKSMERPKTDNSCKQISDFDIVTEKEKLEVKLAVLDNPQTAKMQINTEETQTSIINNQDQSRRPADYIRREAVMRIKHFENKKKIETQILKTQLQIEEIKKRVALFEEEKNKMLLEKAKIELEILKKSLF